MRKKGLGKESDGTRGLSHISVFRRNFILMALLLLTAVAALVVISEFYTKNVTEKYLNQARAQHGHNCQVLDKDLYMTYSIPLAVENTRYYEYIRSLTDDGMPEQYTPVLHYMGKVLANQLYLRGDSIDCFLYLSGTGSVCTSNYGFSKAADCFGKYAVFEKTTAEEIIRQFKTRNNIWILENQKVRIGSVDCGNVVSVLMRPVGNDIGIMTVYRESTILKALNLENLPDNTVLVISDRNGKKILTTEKSGTELPAEHKYYTLCSELPSLRLTAELHIPVSYFLEQVKPVYRLVSVMIALLFVIGLILCFVFSRLSSKPIENLVRRHEEDVSEHNIRSEEERLDHMLNRNKQEISDLKDTVLSNFMIRVFCGLGLSDPEDCTLSDKLFAQGERYRAVILHFPQDVDVFAVLEELKQKYEFLGEVINSRDIGLIIHDETKDMEDIQTFIHEHEENRWCCGVGIPFDEINHFYTSVEQAKIALQSGNRISISSQTETEDGPLSWNMQSRLYQAILSNDRENVQYLLTLISQYPYPTQTEAAQAFHCAGLVIRSAANAMQLEDSAGQVTDYDSSLLQEENFEKIRKQAAAVDTALSERKKAVQDTEEYRILSWILDNLDNPDLCAMNIADHFATNERRVYIVVKNQTGISLGEYIRNERMKKAANLLLSTDMASKDIAEKCGFQSLGTFYRIFKSVYDCTPAQYRQGRK